MIERFHILDHGASRPDAERIIFCDGTGGALFRPDTDLELSHWRPNRTPREYRAGTSTEICFRFLDNSRPGPWTAAVNNHVDVDGILSVYVLVHSRHALEHRQTIIQAAEIGDFWGWGDLPAQRLFQGITRLMSSQKGRHVYEEAFRRIPGLIEGTDPELPEIDNSLQPLQDGVQLVESGRIMRSPINDRFTHYVIPMNVVEGGHDRAVSIPGFNELISDRLLLWPQVRARWDAERICLVSVEHPSGWFHMLWFPGYLWADTEDLWRVPGFHYHDGMQSYEFTDERFASAIAELQRQETSTGSWQLGGTDSSFGKMLQSQFPFVGGFLDDQGNPTLSHLPPEIVAQAVKVAIIVA